MGSNSASLELEPFEVAKEVEAEWNLEQEGYFIELLKENVITPGVKRVNGKLTKNEWLNLRKKYYLRFGLKYLPKAYKNKHQNMKERFREFKALVEKTSGTGFNQALGTFTASDSWWDDYIKTNKKAKHLKRLRVRGCPEYKDLQIIFGDTIATGSNKASASYNFDSTDEENGEKEATAESPMPPQVQISEGGNNRENNDYGTQSTQNKSQSHSRKRERSDPKGPELTEAVKMLAEASQARVEKRGKFSITECVDIIEAMGIEIGRKTYVKAISLFQDKGWREAFLHMSDARRRDVLLSIEEGDL